MNERVEHVGAVATKLLFENDDVKVWEMDVAAGARFPHHHHSLEYLFYVTGPAVLTVSRHGVEPYNIDAKERALYTYPGNKSETFLNNGPGPYREVLVELKRLPRDDQRALSFTKCEALVGQKPVPGTTRILENDRVVISETMLAPAEEAIVASARDAVTYVLEGGHLGVTEPTEGKRARLLEEERPRRGVYWEAAGSSRKLKNLGRGNYRHLTVELK
jgi:beta-alanine degradation protein BauB